MVYFLFVIETSKTLLSTYYILDTFGSNYGVYTQLSKLGVTWLSVPIMTSLGKLICCTSLILIFLTIAPGSERDRTIVLDMENLDAREIVGYCGSHRYGLLLLPLSLRKDPQYKLLYL